MIWNIIGFSIQDGRRDPPSPYPPLSWDLVVPSGFPLDFWGIQVDPWSKLKFLSPQCEISISPTQIKKFRKLMSWYETYQSNNETLFPLCTISSMQRRIHFKKASTLLPKIIWSSLHNYVRPLLLTSLNQHYPAKAYTGFPLYQREEISRVYIPLSLNTFSTLSYSSNSKVSLLPSFGPLSL